MGFVALSPLGRFEAGSRGSFELTYTSGTFGLDDLGAVRVVFRSANDQSPLQTTNPEELGYVTAEASNGAPLEIRYDARGYVRPWYKALTVTAKRFLREGDKIIIRIGDRRNGSPGLRLQTFCEDRLEFRVLVDAMATGLFTPLPASPTISIVPGSAAVWRAVLPSHRRPGERFTLFIKAEDRWGNPTDQAAAILRLASSSNIEGLPREVEFTRGVFQQRIGSLSVSNEADVTIAVASRDGQRLAISNPLRIRQKGPHRFWSDLHGQSEETIGTNSARQYFEFARDRAFLDICGHQANDFQITDSFWDELNKITADFNEQGRFVAVPGYEWSGNTSVGGDRNVWYLNEGRPIFRSSHALVDATEKKTVCHTASDLFRLLRDEDVMVVAHCGGRYADVKYAHDAEKETAVEIHSCWGTFEWIVRDALEAGYRIGIVAASDDHKGRPGASHPGASNFGSYGGVTCHLMNEFSREALFASMRQRHNYATTGSRIWVDVEAHVRRPAALFRRNPGDVSGETEMVRRATMGDILAVDDETFEFAVEILGTAPIERIELRDGLDVVEVIRPYGPHELGRRIRVIWEGAEGRGRGRKATWDGQAELRGNTFTSVRGINLWNADRPLHQTAPHRLAWQSFTTGGLAGFEAVLGDGSGGTLHVGTPALTVEVDVHDIGYEDRVFEAGGVDKRIRVFRLPDDNPHWRVAFRRELMVPLRGEARPYICVTQEDGNRAWSSPLYIFRKMLGPDRRVGEAAPADGAP